MGGLTGALFSEFAFTLTASVVISAIVALTLSPMMCSKFLVSPEKSRNRFMEVIDKHFENLRVKYEKILKNSLNYLPVTAVFSIIILTSIYFLYATSKTELAPQEDQGIILTSLTAAANASLFQTQLYSQAISKIFHNFPETDHSFLIDGANGLNTSIGGMVLKPWDQRKKTSNQLQPEVQDLITQIAGAKIAAFQPAPLPGGGSGLPVQFVIQTTSPFLELNTVAHQVLDKAIKSGQFIYTDIDLKIDQQQANIQLDRDKASELGLSMQDIGNSLSAALSENYINYFSFAGRSYQVIPQVQRSDRINSEQLLNYYVKTSNNVSIPLGTIASIQNSIVPESLNHFQQLNSATILAVPSPGVTLGDALHTLQNIANETLPDGYNIDYASQSRQYMQEGTALVKTFFFALVIIFLALSALFESFRDPVIVLVSVPMSICGALIFVSLGIGSASLNIYSEVGLVTLIGLISKHGILVVQFANDLQRAGKSKREAIEIAAGVRLRPILMTTAAMVLGVIPLITASGAGALSRFNIGLVISTGIAIGTLFTLFVVPAVYLMLAAEHHQAA